MEGQLQRLRKKSNTRKNSILRENIHQKQRLNLETWEIKQYIPEQPMGQNRNQREARKYPETNENSIPKLMVMRKQKAG